MAFGGNKKNYTIDDGSLKSAIGKGSIRPGSNPVLTFAGDKKIQQQQAELAARKAKEEARRKKIEKIKNEIKEVKDKMDIYNTAMSSIADAIAALRAAESELQGSTESLLEACSGTRVETINSSINSSMGSIEDIASVLNVYRSKAQERYNLLENALTVLENNLAFA